MITQRKLRDAIESAINKHEREGSHKTIKMSIPYMYAEDRYVTREDFNGLYRDFTILCDYLTVEITTTPEKRAVVNKEK